jgi:hypothetical protein
MGFEYLVGWLSSVLHRVVGAGNHGMRAAGPRGDGICDVLKPWDHPRRSISGVAVIQRSNSVIRDMDLTSR